MLMWVSFVDVNDVITSDTSTSLGKTFFPSCLASVVEEAFLYVGYILQFFCRSPMGPCPSESLSLGLCSPAFLSFDGSDDSPFLPSYLTSAGSTNTVNMLSSLHPPPFLPPILNTFTAEVSKYSFNRSLILRGKVSNSAWSSMHVPAQITSSKQVRAYAMGLLGPILYRASAFYVMLIHVSTSHFLPAPPPVHYLFLVGNSPLLWHLAVQSKQNLTYRGCKASKSVFPYSFVTSSCFTAESSQYPLWQGSSAAEGIVACWDFSSSKANGRGLSELRPPPRDASALSGAVTSLFLLLWPQTSLNWICCWRSLTLACHTDPTALAKHVDVPFTECYEILMDGVESGL